MSVYWLIRRPRGTVRGSKSEEAESIYAAKSYAPGTNEFLRGCRVRFSENNLTLKNEGTFPISALPIEDLKAPITLNPGEEKSLKWDTIRVTTGSVVYPEGKRKRKKETEPQTGQQKKKIKLDLIESGLTTKGSEMENEDQKEEKEAKMEYSFVLYREVSYPDSNTNFLFYTNKTSSKPDCMYINDFHTKWFGNYKKLEECHGFIQWLFPIFEASAFNWSSVPLSRTEARLIRRDKVAARNVVESYKLMLDFYGLRLVDERTGKIDYVEDKSLKRSRMKNLNESGHNYLRITRILKSLGHLGFTRYKKPLLDALHKALFTDNLVPNARDSFKRYWAATTKYDSPNYFKFTREIPEDREPSIFFDSL